MVGGFEEVEEDKGFIMGFGEGEFHPCKALAVMLQVYRRRFGSRILIHFYYSHYLSHYQSHHSSIKAIFMNYCLSIF